MRNTTKFVLLVGAAFCATNIFAAKDMTKEILINEVMQSTFGGELDKLNEYPDGWVELYNPGEAAVNLKDYRIGKKKFDKCFKMPNIEIAAKGYLVLICDKEEVTVKYTEGGVEQKEIHTDFRITTDKESEVNLFDPNEALVDMVEIPVMASPNVAWGRATDGADEWGWELKVTCGYANEGGLAKMVLPEPKLKTKSIVSANGEAAGFKLDVEYPEADFAANNADLKNLCIRYTLDGSEPTAESPLFEEAIYSKNNVAFRASIFADECVTPVAPTAVLIKVGHRITLPVVSLVTSEADLNDPAYGIFANNAGAGAEKNDWRRPAFFDFFAAEGEATLSQRCEIRVAGGWSRENRIKSLAVYAKDRFGTPDYFEQQFWPNTKPQIEKSPSIMLRSAGNDFGGSYMRDGVAQMVVGNKVDVDWQGFQPAIYFINLKYQGIINIRERSNEDNVWANYDGLEDVTVIENTEVKEGKEKQYEEFCEFFNANHSFEEINALMDVSEYMNHMILNAYMSNTDFPGNNNLMWRPTADGGRWRWILKDVDRSFNIWGSLPADHQYLKWMLNDPCTGDANTPEGTKVIKYLMKNDEFKQMFIDRYTVLLGDVFRPAEVISVIDWCYNTMKPEWQYFNNGNNTWGWDGEINNMKQWSRDRYTFMQKNLKDYFGLGKQVATTVNIDNDLAIKSSYTVNDSPLSRGEFDGSFYANRTYTIKAENTAEGEEVKGWNVVKTNTNGKDSYEYVAGNELVITPSADIAKLKINATTSETSIKEVKDDAALRIVETIYTNIQGLSSDKPLRGINMVRHILSDGTMMTEKILSE